MLKGSPNARIAAWNKVAEIRRVTLVRVAPSDQDALKAAQAPLAPERSLAVTAVF
jgi:hypothetical protein